MKPLMAGVAGLMLLATAVRADIDGFGDGSGFMLNGNAAAGAAGIPVILSADELQITSLAGGEAASVFYNTPQAIGGFTVQFDYQMVGGSVLPADGMAFVIQNDPRGPTALGGPGHLRGYAGSTEAIQNSFAISLNLFNAPGVVEGLNGTFGTVHPTGPVDLAGGNTIHTTIQYDGALLSVTLQDLVTSGTFSTSWQVDIPGAVGADVGYVGFTGATGGFYADQRITNFVYTELATLTWDESGSNVWDSPHWLGGPPAIPSEGTHAVLAATNADTVTVSAAAEALSLTVDGGEVLVTGGGTLSVVRETRLGSGGTVTLDGGTITTEGFDNTAGGTFNHYDGTLTVRGGTYAPGTASLTVNGNTPTALPHLVLDGAAPAATFSGIRIGDDAKGALTVSGGTVLSSSGAHSFIGYAAGSEGTVTVDGSGSELSNWGLHVGESGTGTLVITNGGQVSSAYGNVGTMPGSTGHATVDGAGSVWTASGMYVGGSASAAGGTGTLTVSNGGEVNVVGDALKLWTAGTVTLDGGRISTQAFDRTSGTFNWNAGMVRFTNNLLVDAGQPFGSSVTVGTGRNLEVADTLTVGPGGTVTLDGGRIATQAFDRTAGTFNWNAGTLRFTNNLLVDTGQPFGSAVSVTSGRDLEVANTLTVGAGGTVTLDGGRIATQAFDRTAGTFNWNAGTLRFTNNLLVDAGQPFGSAVSVTSGRDLEVANTLTVGAGGTVTLDGGTIITGSLDNTSGGTFNHYDGALAVRGGTYAPGTTDLTVNGNTPTALPHLVLDGATPAGAFNNLYVGDDAQGALTVTGGGQVSSNLGYVGYAAGSTGDVTVDGAGSTWDSSGRLYLAYSGTGALSVQNGGTVLNTDGLLGYYSSGSGTATVDGAGSTWTNSGFLSVGSSGTGTLNVQNGGSVTNTDGYLGFNSTAFGTATVDGAGSTWVSSGFLTVGGSGTGTLTVTGGGEVSTTGAGYVGYAVGSTGEVTVDGSGSTWTTTGNLYVGGSSAAAGGPGTLTVTDGGWVDVGGTLKLWAPGTVTLDGGRITTGAFDRTSGTFNWNAGMLWFTNNLLVDAGQPFGSSVTVGSGRYLLVDNTLTLGSGGTVTLDGGTIITFWLDRTAGTFTWNAGTLLFSTDLMVDAGQPFGSSVTVGSGRVLDVFDTLALGSGGTITLDGGTIVAETFDRTAGTFNWNAGTVAFTRDVYVGAGKPFGDSVTVTSGCNLEVAGWLHVGLIGGKGTLEVTGGGEVSTRVGIVGYQSSATGEVTVDGSGSTWTTTSFLSVGYDGGAGTLEITGGGQVETGDAGIVGFQSSATGEVTVDGIGSKWTTGANADFLVGFMGNGTLAVTGGGQVETGRRAFVAYGAGRTGTVTVDGSGSTWTTTGNLYVGGSDSAAGGTGTLTVTDGGEVSVGDTLKLWAPGTVTLDGGTIATQAFDRTSGTFNWNAGTVAFTNNLLVDAGQPFGSSVSVTSGRDLEVANTLTVGPGGTVTLDGGTIITGSLDNTSGGTFNHYDGALAVRGGTYAPGTASLTVNGNTPTALPHLVLDGATPPGAFNNLYVGDDAQGALTVTGGGQVSSNLGYVGYAAGSTGEVTVDGSGSKWTIDESLYVGGSHTAAGGQGTLTVQNDGLVSVGGTLRLWPTGRLTVDGGTVTAGGLAGLAGAVVNLRDPAGGTALTVGSGESAAFLGGLGNVLGGVGSLRKVGTGTQTLGGVNSWTGTTDIDEGVLALPSGFDVNTGGPVTVAPGAELRVGGFLARPVTGSGTVTATGWLVAGDGGSPTGWNFPGTLGVGAHSVLLLDADVAELGALTTLAEGGRLDSFAGARLGPDGSADPARILAAAASATVDGVFTNNGLVEGPTDPGQWLTFEDDVDGLGTFTGNIHFRGDYTVGMGAAPLAATTCFEGSTVLVGEGCGLDLDGPTMFERTVTKTGAGWLTVDGPQDHGTDALLEILAGTVWLNTDASGTGLMDDADLSILVTDATLNFGCNQHLDTLEIGDGGLVRFAGANTVVVKHLIMNGVDLGATTMTPEPATLALVALGGLGVLLGRRRK